MPGKRSARVRTCVMVCATTRRDRVLLAFFTETIYNSDNSQRGVGGTGNADVIRIVSKHFLFVLACASTHRDSSRCHAPAFRGNAVFNHGVGRGEC